MEFAHCRSPPRSADDGHRRCRRFNAVGGGQFGRRQWFLDASTEWPGVVPADVEIGNLGELAGKYPVVAADLRAIADSVQHVAPSGTGPR